MKKSFICLSVFAVCSGFVYANNDYVVIIDQENSDYLSEEFLRTGEITCSNTSPLESEIYKNINFVQSNTGCQEKLESASGAVRWEDVDDFSTNEVGTHLSNSCKEIKDFDSNLPSNNYDILVNGSELNVVCDMELDNGGWTKVASVDRESAVIGAANNGVNLVVDDLNLTYTEVLYFDRDSDNDYGGSTMYDGVWDWDGLDFGKNVFKFDNDWAAMDGKFVHACNTLTKDLLPASSYRVIEHNVTACFDEGNINKLNECGRKVAVTVPTGKRLTGFSDVETVLNTCRSDNRFKQHFDLYVR